MIDLNEEFTNNYGENIDAMAKFETYSYVFVQKFHLKFKLITNIPKVTSNNDDTRRSNAFSKICT